MSTPIFTLGALLQASAARQPDADAVVLPDRRLTHGQLATSARRWAKALIAMGVQPGQHVGVLLTTRVEFIEIYFGIAMAGAVAVPVNARYQPAELGYLIANADLVALVTTGRVADTLDFTERLLGALPSLRHAADPQRLSLDEAPRLAHVVCLDPPCPPFMVGAGAALDAGGEVSDAVLDARIAAVEPNDTALVLYTSGTTSSPKGCMTSHRATIGNARNLGGRYRVGPQDKVWSPLPIFHIAGILTMTMAIDAGGAYLTIPHFEAGSALEMLGREGATIAYPSFVTIMQDLIAHPSFKDTDLSKLRLMNSNFAVQPDWIREAVVKAMPHTVQVGTYGLTEGSGTVTTSRIDDPFELRTGRLGTPLEEWEVRIVDPGTGLDAATGERGEILIRGPNMLKGYYNAPEKTAEVIDADGWAHTGDIGSLDSDGHLLFHGRTKDMLKVGGENVAATEIEVVLQAHPAVRLAQVVGVPDPRYEEVPAAFVELAAGQSATEAELIAHCRGRLSNFKLPRHVRFVAEWPMSTSKIQKFRLRERLVEELARGTAA